MDEFKVRLMQLRIDNNLTQKQLAKLLGATDDSIYSWEKGRAEPSIDMIKRICVCLDVTSDYLLGLSD